MDCKITLRIQILIADLACTTSGGGHRPFLNSVINGTVTDWHMYTIIRYDWAVILMLVSLHCWFIVSVEV